MIKSKFTTAFCFMLFYAHRAEAAWTLSNPSPKGGATLEEFVYLLLSILQTVAVPAFAMCVIYGGFLLVTAGGNEAQVEKAKQWVLWSLVGGVIILGAKVIADVVFGTGKLF